MKILKLNHLFFFLSFIFLTSCGDYGDPVYRIDNYLYSDDYGTSSCLMNYEGERVVKLDYFFSDGGDFMDDGYELIYYDGNNILLEGYWPNNDQIIHQTNIYLQISNGLLQSYRFEDLYDFNAERRYDFFYKNGAIELVRRSEVRNGVLTTVSELEYYFDEGGLDQSDYYYIMQDGARVLAEIWDYTSANNQIQDFTRYLVEPDQNRPIEGEIRAFNQWGLSQIQEYEVKDEEWQLYGTRTITYLESGHINTESYSEIYDGSYAYQLEYQEGNGNYSQFNFLLFAYLEDLFLEYPKYKTAEKFPHRKLRGLSSLKRICQ